MTDTPIRRPMIFLKLLGAAVAAALAGQALADGATTVQQQCGSCHAVEAPAFAALGVAERMQRQAPPLFFAGNKYREGWLEQWLQDPQPIHPAGYFPAAPAVITTEEGDLADPQARYQHAALDASTASEVAAYLMTLKPHDALIAEVNYTPGNVALRMGTMDFRKFKGCDACHQDAVDEGGLSGPTMYDAWQRLQPQYMSSFITDPTRWDPNTIMPRMRMNEAAVNKLVDYLRVIGGEE